MVAITHLKQEGTEEPLGTDEDATFFFHSNPGTLRLSN